jgi:hypothetical protein
MPLILSLTPEKTRSREVRFKERGMRLLFVVLLLLGMAYGAEKDQAPITLVATSSRPLDVAGFSAWGEAQCDLDGSLYFHTGLYLNDLIFLKLGSDDTHQLYTIQESPEEGEYYGAFRISSDGKLWVLAGEKNDSISVLEYGDDPKKPTRTRLGTPDQFDPLSISNFAVLQNEHVRIYGVLGERAPKQEQGRRYSMEFDASGKLVRKTMDKTSDGSTAADRYKDASAAQGIDGTLYVLAEDKVLVMSPTTGRLIRNIKFRPPEPGFEAHQLYVAGRRIVVGFQKANPGTPLAVLYALFDATSGEQLRLYQPPPEIGNNMVCFSNDGFTFSTVENRHIVLVTAAVN